MQRPKVFPLSRYPPTTSVAPPLNHRSFHWKRSEIHRERPKEHFWVWVFGHVVEVMRDAATDRGRQADRLFAVISVSSSPPLSLLPISYPGIAAADLALVACVLHGFGIRRDLDADSGLVNVTLLLRALEYYDFQSFQVCNVAQALGCVSKALP